MYPGQFPNLRFNLFNIVVALDLSQTSSLSFIGSTITSLISRSLPFTWGVAPLVETEDGKHHICSLSSDPYKSSQGARMARLFYYLVENFGRSKTMEFIQRVSIHPPSYSYDEMYM